jgi:hypothetical protein
MSISTKPRLLTDKQTREGTNSNLHTVRCILYIVFSPSVRGFSVYLRPVHVLYMWPMYIVYYIFPIC